MRAPSPQEEEDQADEEPFPFFQVDKVKDIEPCSAPDCSLCGFSSSFCTVCESGMTRSDGRCLSKCKEGFFDAEGVCFRCSPMCQSCSQTAN